MNSTSYRDLSLPAPPPATNPETLEFWQATKQGRLLLSRCPACGLHIWYPRAICPDCHSHPTEWVQAAGTGTIYSFTIIRSHAPGPYAGIGPYVVAYVELTEGPRMLTNIVGCDLEKVRIGEAVDVVFADAGQSGSLPRFRLSAPRENGTTS